MKLRILPLILVLALALAGCTGGQVAENTQSPAPTPDITDAAESTPPSQEPTPTPAPSPEATPVSDPTEVPAEATPVSDPIEVPADATPAPAYTHHPDAHHTVTPAPAYTHHPDVHHPAASPTPTPSATPEPTPEPAAVTAQSLYEAAMSGAGLKVADFVDNSDYMTAFYTTMDTSNLDEFIYCSVGMSATNQEFFIAKVKSGKVDAVKSACQDRLQGMKEEMETYPDSGIYVDSYQLVTKGDWLMFCVCPDAAKAVEAFKNGIK